MINKKYKTKLDQAKSKRPKPLPGPKPKPVVTPRPGPGATPRTGGLKAAAIKHRKKFSPTHPPETRTKRSTSSNRTIGSKRNTGSGWFGLGPRS